MKSKEGRKNPRKKGSRGPSKEGSRRGAPIIGEKKNIPVPEYKRPLGPAETYQALKESEKKKKRREKTGEEKEKRSIEKQQRESHGGKQHGIPSKPSIRGPGYERAEGKTLSNQKGVMKGGLEKTGKKKRREQPRGAADGQNRREERKKIRERKAYWKKKKSHRKKGYKKKNFAWTENLLGQPSGEGNLARKKEA